MKCSIKWTGDARFEAKSGTGHSIVMDGPEEHGGKNQGPRPMEMIILGLGGCANFDVIHILRKSRQEVENCQVFIDAERADAVPAVFTKIHLHFVVSGKSLKDASVKRAVDLSAEKYCSASIMLEKAGVEISHDYEIEQLES